MRRILPIFAALALMTLGLTACGSDAEDPPPTTAESVADDSADADDETPSDDDAPSEQEDETSDDESADQDEAESETPSDSTTESDEESDEESESEAPEDDSEDPSDEASPSEEASDDGQDSEDADSGAGAATVTSTLWIDDSWSIEDLDEDLCEMGGMIRSQYAQDDDMFVCGPTAAGAEACDIESGSEVLCITDPVDRTAIRFDSPAAEGGEVEQGDGPLIPLYVHLDDGSDSGIRCATISHDHDRHWHDKLSWYRCEDGSELLTDDLIEQTFDQEQDRWTAQRSVDKGEPEEIGVKDAVFAGND
jgi:hypothetical protein